MARIDRRGVSDVLAVAFMFILLAMATVFISNFIALQLEPAIDRQLELKSEHLYQALKNSWVMPHGLPIIRAIAEQLIIPEEPTVDNDYLASYLENTLEYLLPQGYGAAVKLVYGEKVWELTYPTGAEVEKNFAETGTIPFIISSENAGQIIEVVEVETNVFTIPQS
ncbi:MAG: hypothetical protein J7J17_03525 [Hadesarchaea archaeon]|nr:hypothetical protein [Hadesarchaea archaeon]